VDSTLFAVCMLILGAALGALAAGATYAMELRRMARFIRERQPRSNARLTVQAAAPALQDLAAAVNAELDRAMEERIAAQRHTQEFQRDLSALSHDIRTPLMGAKGYLQLALDEDSPQGRQRHLSAATDRIDSTIVLLDQLFLYTKASDPDLALNMQPIALRPVVERVLIAHYPDFEARGWEPTLTFEDQGLLVQADEDALARILENLITNALRYGASAPALAQQTQDGRPVLDVANQVQDPAAIDPTRIFERFYQADASRGKQGAGLGLATAAKLATAMGMCLSASIRCNQLVIRLHLSVE